MDEKNNTNWKKDLKDFTYNYNHSIHSTIGFKPVEVNKKNEKQVLKIYMEGGQGNMLNQNLKLVVKY